jgi:hypothetical protein
MKLFEIQTKEEWDSQLQNIIDFIITETNDDTFLEIIENIRKHLICLVTLRRYLKDYDPLSDSLSSQN